MTSHKDITELLIGIDHTYHKADFLFSILSMLFLYSPYVIYACKIGYEKSWCDIRCDSPILGPYWNNFGGYTDNIEQEQIEIDVARQLLYAENDTVPNETQTKPETRRGWA